MNLTAVFENYGLGVMATADREGLVNTAVYARPHMVDETTLVWGVTESRTYRNICQNPHASYLIKTAAQGFSGVRLGLKLLRIEDEGEMLEEIRRNTSRVVGPGAGSGVTHAAWFRIVEIRSLV